MFETSYLLCPCFLVLGRQKGRIYSTSLSHISTNILGISPSSWRAVGNVDPWFLSKKNKGSKRATEGQSSSQRSFSSFAISLASCSVTPNTPQLRTMQNARVSFQVLRSFSRFSARKGLAKAAKAHVYIYIYIQ